MAGKVYDLAQLTEGNGIDCKMVKLFFYDNREYFDALTNFIDHFGHPLAHYTPAFVVNSPDDRTLFMKDCLTIRTKLMQLGLTLALRELDVMENAVSAGAAKEFADGQIKFAAAIEIYMKVIKDAFLH
jgi:hypothetical protein